VTVLKQLVVVAGMTCSLVMSPAEAQGPALDARLAGLAPLFGKTWIGGYVSGPGVGLEFTLRWEPILRGTAVRGTREVPELENSAEIIYFWDPETRGLAYLKLNSRGIVERGTLRTDGSKLVCEGTSRGRFANGVADETREFQTALEILPDGTLRETMLIKQDGAWAPAHVQEFKASAG